MANLFCFGLGYSATHYIAEYCARFFHIAGTVRTREKAAAVIKDSGGRAKAFVFDGDKAAGEIEAELKQAEALLVSVPPGEDGDPVLAQFAESIAAAPN